MAAIIIAAIDLPVLFDNIGNALFAHRQNIQPEQHRPEAVLFAHMVGARARAFLTADGGHIGVKQIAEKFPAGGRLEHADAEFGGHAVGGGAGGHGTGNALQARFITGCQMRIGRQHGQRVGRRDKLSLADDQIAVAVTIRSGAKIRPVCRHGEIINKFGMNQIGVGVVVAKIGQRRAIDDRARCRAQCAL